MSKRGAGVAFCGMAAGLMSMDYLAAAIYGSNASTWGRDYFRSDLEYVGPVLPVLAGMALLVGLFYLVRAELEK
jgi:hypothetical protein